MFHRSNVDLPPDDAAAGFTLMELMVVVLVIGVLAAVAVPAYFGIRARADDAVLQSDLTHAKTATVLWSHSRDTTSRPALDQLVEWGYTPSPYAGAGVAPSYKDGSTAVLFCLVGTSGSGQQFSVTAHGSVRKGFCPFSASEW